MNYPAIRTTYYVIPVETGIQTSSPRRRGAIMNWVPVFTGNPGFPIGIGPVPIYRGMTDKGVDH